MLGSSTAVSPIGAATANIESKSKVNAYGSKQRLPFCFRSPIHISVTNRECYSTGEKIHADDLWCGYEFAWQMDAILFLGQIRRALAARK
jgi:hypothetical protein